jgi:mRNA interferase MazF
MPYGQRDLLLVPVPFSDLSRRKVRPVVVLSNDSYNAQGPDLLVAGIASNPSPRPYVVPVDTPQLEEGQMRKASIVRADKLFSIDQSIVLARFGRINLETHDRVSEQIHALLRAASVK